MPHVVIIGGGLSGLAVAYRLQQAIPGVSVRILESRHRPGGNIGTELHNGFRVETGPNGFLDRTPFIPKLCQDLGLGDRLIAGSEAARKNRYLFLDGRLRKLPGSLLGLLSTSLLSPRGKWQLLTEAFRKVPATLPVDESVADFVTRRAGKEAADLFADALVTGIQAGDPVLLSVAAAFPRLPQMEREAGSLFKGFLRASRERRQLAKAQNVPPPGPQRMWSFREGLGVLIDELVHQVGPVLTTGVRVTSIETSAAVANWVVRAEGRDSWSADAVVLACPAYEQAAILADLDPELADDIAAIPYNRIAVVALGYRKADCPGQPEGFGYIAPQNTRRDVLGVQWCSSIYPDRAPEGFVLWRALCGGINRADMFDRDDDALVRAVHEEMRLSMGVTRSPVFTRVVRWPNAIPQYMIGHLDRVARIEARVKRYPRLLLTGNAYRGVAMGDCAEQAQIVAAKLALDFFRK